MAEAVIVACTRTPIGRARKGSLTGVRADDLAGLTVRAALDSVPELPDHLVEDVIVGCAQPAGEQGYNLGRVVSVLAGLRDVPGTTVNRYCASSLQALRIAAHAIRAGEGEAFIAAGAEAVSRYTQGKADSMPDTHNPRFGAAEARTGERAIGGAPPWTPRPDLPDIYVAMGQTAENVAELEKVTRDDMDAWAALSHQRAVAAQDAGVFDAEITPVPLPGGGLVSADDCPRRGTNVHTLAELKPVFRPDGRVTAGNSCPLNDGAAAAVVMSDTLAAHLGIRPMARIVSTAVSALDPEIMGLGPVEASRRALSRAGMTMGDVDLIEINEAFAAQVLPSARALRIPEARLNIHGGAIALGHPFGMTGVRILTTLLNALGRTGGTIGLEAMCVGGGQGMAMVLERLE
ncbi:MAG TPA: acetyl-CoA C-acetyltransferase [Streptosporangiaceae bacterium]|nr:acetyl-CoA C-acetyltransferase [Streptosporangiaceae bacterium]